MLGERFDTFIDDLIEVSAKPYVEYTNIFENLRINEDKMRFYASALIELEKIVNEVHLDLFTKQYEYVKDILLDFNPNDIDHEIGEVHNIIASIENNRSEYESIYSSFEEVKTQWNAFIVKNENIIGSSLENSFRELYEQVIEDIRTSDSVSMAKIGYSISQLKKKAQKIIEYVDRLTIFNDKYIFLGERAEVIKDKIDLLLSFQDISTDKDFFDKVDEIKEEIVGIEKVWGTVGFEVLKAEQSDSGIFEYTIEVNGSPVEYDSFFKSPKIHYTNTGEYIYFDNFPREGVFHGREIVESVDISEAYLKAVENMKERMDNYFSAVSFSEIALALYAGISQDMLTSILAFGGAAGIYFSLPPVYSFLKKSIEIAFKVPNFYQFIPIDYVVFKRGKEFHINDLLMQMIREFDDRFILNSGGSHKWIKTYQ